MNKTLDIKVGNRMHALVTKLFPICRSITGNGFRQSLDVLLHAMGGGRKRKF